MMETYDTTARIAVLENEVKNIGADVKEMRQEAKEQHELLMKKMGALDKRLEIVERWRWMVVGAATVVGYILAHVRLERFIG